MERRRKTAPSWHNGAVPPRTYSPDEVQAILAHALERGHDGAESLTHEELLSVARELGIADAAIEDAARTVGDSLVVKREVEGRLRARRRSFVSHLVPYVLVNTMLVLLNLQTGGPYWFFWPLFGWGIGLVLHGRSAFFPDQHALEAQVQRKLAREREREEKRLRRERGKGSVEDAAKEVVAGALGLVADALQDSRRPRSRPPRAEGESRSRGDGQGQGQRERVRVKTPEPKARPVSFADAEDEETATRDERRRTR